jgi:hypothetical protein
VALGLALAIMGLASIWAFVGPDYKNAPEDPVPAVSLLVVPSAAIAPATARIVLI